MGTLVDPWAASNQAMQNLGNTFTDMANQKRQANMDAVNLRRLAMQEQIQQMTLDDFKKKSAEDAELKSVLSSPPGGTQETQFAPSGSLPDVSGIPSAIQTPTLDTTPQQNPSVFNTPGEIKTTFTTPANKTKMAIDFYESKGNLAAANKLKTDVAAQAKQLVDITGDPMAGLKHLNDALGADYKTMKVHSYEILKNGDQPVALFDKAAMDQLQASGMSASEAATKAMIPLSLPGGNGQVVSAFLAANANPTPQQLWDLASKNNIPLKQIEPIISMVQKGKSVEQLTAGALKGNKEDQAVLDAMQGRQLGIAKANRAIVVNNPMPAKVNVNGVPEEHQKALDDAVAEGRLDPYKVNSRNRQDLARQAYNNPGINLNQIAANLGLARNKDVIMKAAIASKLPELLRNVVKAGKDLNYSNFAPAGKIEQVWDKAWNDPKLNNYMTQRNDLILTIGGVMRANGMTDIAQRLEEDAAPKTMSPKAFEGWLSGQMKALDPRLDLYGSIVKGKGIPNSGGGKTGAQIAPSGIKAKLKDGRTVTSDGKGGWD